MSIQPSTTTSFINDERCHRNSAAIQPMPMIANVQHQFAMPPPNVVVDSQQYSSSSFDGAVDESAKTLYNNGNQYSSFVEQDQIYGSHTLSDMQRFHRRTQFATQRQQIYSENPYCQQRTLIRSHSTASANLHASNSGTFNFRNSQNGVNSCIYELSTGPRSTSRSLDEDYSTSMGLKSKLKKNSTDGKIVPELNVAEMILHGVADSEILKTWLTSIDCEEYCKNFIEHGYDMPTITRMTPQDLTAIGCTIPTLRRKLQVEIRKLNLNDGIPDHKPNNLDNWLELLRLDAYYDQLCDQGYNSIEKVCELTWEDLEEIGIKKLGHQKRLLLGIDRIKELDKQSEKNDHAIYDVNPNHRITLMPDARRNDIYGTLLPIRQPNMQQRSIETKKGTPVATVMPALKDPGSMHVRNSVYRVPEPNVPQMAHQSIMTVPPPPVPPPAPPILQVNAHDSRTLMKHYGNSNSTTLLGKGRRVQPPVPPMRTNSLRVSSSPYLRHNNNHDNNNMNNNNDSNCNNINFVGSIYGNHTTVANEMHARPHIIQMPSSFSRVPRLGTLTSTTNKMLTNGGHLQMNGYVPIHPIREAPLPPVLPPIGKINEEPMQHPSSIDSPSLSQSSSALSCTASVATRDVTCTDFEEFPPPPSPIAAEVYHDTTNTEVEAPSDSMSRLSISTSTSG